jgi:hypothetical protein
MITQPHIFVVDTSEGIKEDLINFIGKFPISIQLEVRKVGKEDMLRFGTTLLIESWVKTPKTQNMSRGRRKG